VEDRYKDIEIVKRKNRKRNVSFFVWWYNGMMQGVVVVSVFAFAAALDCEDHWMMKLYPQIEWFLVEVW
jgi:hypothetical protein